MAADCIEAETEARRGKRWRQLGQEREEHEQRQRLFKLESPIHGPTRAGLVDGPVGPCVVPISNPVDVGRSLAGVFPPPSAGPDRVGRFVS